MRMEDDPIDRPTSPVTPPNAAGTNPPPATPSAPWYKDKVWIGIAIVVVIALLVAFAHGHGALAPFN